MAETTTRGGEVARRISRSGALFLCSLTPAATAAGQELPFRYDESGLPMVRATIDGRHEGWFLFDTGASGHVLHDAVAEELELPQTGTAEAWSPGVVRTTRLVEGEELQIGPHRFAKPAFSTADLTAVGSRELVPSGIIGFDSFEASVLEFDYFHGRILLHGREDFAGDGLAWQPLVVRKRMACVAARIEGSDEVLALDTGSNAAVLLWTPAVARLGLLDDRATGIANTRNTGGRSTYVRAELARVDLGGLTWTDTTALLSTVEKGAHAMEFPAGNVGCVYLQRFTLFVDCAGERIAWRPHAVPGLDLQQYAGRYGAGDEADAEVVVAEPGLSFGDASRRFPMVAVGRDRFCAVDGLQRLEFVREGGALVAVDFQRPGRPRSRLPRR